jgi:hypothetical protein
LNDHECLINGDEHTQIPRVLVGRSQNHFGLVAEPEESTDGPVSKGLYEFSHSIQTRHSRAIAEQEGHHQCMRESDFGAINSSIPKRMSESSEKTISSRMQGHDKGEISVKRRTNLAPLMIL